jgi:hypothetical protein
MKITKVGCELNEIRDLVQGLSEKERAETLALSSSVMLHIQSLARDRQGLARDLIALQRILKPHKIWTQWLHCSCWNRFGISRATASRIIAAHIEQKVMNPIPALAAGIIPPAKKPPVTIHVPQKTGRWRKEIDVDQVAREAFRYWRSRIDLIPARQRAEVTRLLAGSMLAYIGVGNSQSIAPVAVPREWLPYKKKVA